MTWHEPCITWLPCWLQSTRSYLYVEDVAEAFDVILHKGVIGETYNIGTQKERTVMDVANAIARHFSVPEERIIHVRDRAFNDQRCSLGLRMPFLQWPAHDRFCNMNAGCCL